MATGNAIRLANTTVEASEDDSWPHIETSLPLRRSQARYGIKFSGVVYLIR